MMAWWEGQSSDVLMLALDTPNSMHTLDDDIRGPCFVETQVYRHDFVINFICQTNPLLFHCRCLSRKVSLGSASKAMPVMNAW